LFTLNLKINSLEVENVKVISEYEYASTMSVVIERA
jgi:hypothetical protein